ncbi:uncharacterized protein H6S33_000946 [Morchella sextelata]|uniref:uncharacterized protein n=1 Tax=Morchella sextelata TaxID=1174677 RepID=UPI001D0564F5|nr:uncharacterized protein H6S33_000946 [Morchella sextelata]KAH0615310.1 hypothetical protein H6S33_000946 [Morchella sextelata]
MRTSRTSRQTWSPAPQSSAQRPTMTPSRFSHFDITHDEFSTSAFVDQDGRVHIDFNKLKEGPLSMFLNGAKKSFPTDGVKPDEEDEVTPPPKLNIVVMVIGSRGDVQPFVAVAKILAEQGGHRVRLATHPAFKEFVEENGVEFFDIGGDPAELMAFMVKNPGLIPSLETIKAGDVIRRREQMFEMFQGFWRACIEPNDGSFKKNKKRRDQSTTGSVTTSDWGSDEEDDGREIDGRPFIADAIIANPPCFAHVHCAEKLGVPLHLMFTFPYSPTQTMPHPLANITNSNVGSEYTNAISYPMIEMMTWQGLGDLVNRFREKTLCLEPVATLWAPGMISRLKVPFTYMWSPALIPKPHDWGDHIDITGFVFLDLASSFKPPKSLADFLAAGPPPVYIGFGSIVVDDPDGLTALIFEAVKQSGVRALVSKGWGGIGGEDGSGIPENIFMLENTPHDWLFSQVSCVVHHGGAGTTAIGLYHGRPTMIVPFFGDQAFWGATVANANAGAEPVPHKELTAEKLAAGIKKLLSEECQTAAKEISRRIKEDDGDGAENAVKSFYRGIEALKRGKRGLGERGKEWGEGGPGGPGEGKWGSGGPGIHCAMLNDKVAVWRIRRTRTRLSALVAWALVKEGKLGWKDLRLVRHTEWNDFDGPGEPLSGGFSALFGSVAGVAKGAVSVPYSWYKGARRFDEEEGLDIAGEIRERSSSKAQSRSRSNSKRGRKPNKDSSPTSHKKDATPDRVPDTGVRKQIGSIPEDEDADEGEQEEQEPIHREMAHNTAKGLSKVARAGVRAPMEVSLAVAQGFHNAPRLYGDTVRAPYRITGIHSGLRAAGKEFALGVYDGVTGVVVKPYEGAKEDGAVGFAKGLGKGVASGFFKTNAATAGVIGFTLKGVHKEVRKKRDRKVMVKLMNARIRQGEMEYREWREEKGEQGEKELREVVLAGWEKIKAEKEEKKQREWRLEENISGVKRGCGRRGLKRLVWRKRMKAIDAEWEQ